MTESLRKYQVNQRKKLVSLSKFIYFFADILSGRRQSDPRSGYPIRLLYNAFWAIKSFNVHLQLCPDIMHNWSLGNVLHVLDAIVWEQSTFLQSFTVHRAAQGGAAQETQVIPDAAIVRLYTITLKATLESYANDTTNIRFTDRARRRALSVYSKMLNRTTRNCQILASTGPN